MRHHIGALDDHLVHIGIPVVSALCEDRHTLKRNACSVFLLHHFRHGHAVGFRCGIQKGLGDAIPNGGMQSSVFIDQAVDLFCQMLECGCILSDEMLSCHIFNDRNEVLGDEQRVSSACTGVLHGSAVSMSDFSVFQDQHDGDAFSWQTNGIESFRLRLSHIHESVMTCTIDNGTLVVEIKPCSTF